MFIHLQPLYQLKTLQNNFYTYNLLFYHVMEDVRVIRKLQMDDTWTLDKIKHPIVFHYSTQTFANNNKQKKEEI